MFDYQQKIAGVLLHISSLPSGCMGSDAYRFIDFIETCGLKIWQTLPVNMTHDDKSPYQCLSAHAGNPDLISLEELQTYPWIQQALPADRANALSAAFQQFNSHASDLEKTALQQFCQQHRHWLEDFALFLSLREGYANQAWNNWPQALKTRSPEAIAQAKLTRAEQMALHCFTQFIFFKQWQSLKQYAQTRGISMFGDIPIFVSYDSADVWSKPSQFKLDEDLQMTVVAGVPPDYFSATGQRWGNPHYNWQVMQEDGFAWWLERMQTQSILFDILRIDHFRGLQAAWAIPSEEITALNGEWQPAPGAELLGAIRDKMPELKLIAEDLGIITDDVEALKQQFALPGMKILQFAFDGNPNNPYLPEQITANDVVYTGTHDNDTTLGWYESLSPEQKQIVQDYLRHRLAKDEICMPQDLVEMALASNAFLAIIPMQDILLLDGQHRMNLPGTTTGNWSWQFAWAQLKDTHISTMQGYLQHHGRVH